MARTAPEFNDVVSDDCMERLIDFVLHYTYELEEELKRTSKLTAHRRAQLSLLRRMQLDLGLSVVDVYIDWRT